MTVTMATTTTTPLGALECLQKAGLERYWSTLEAAGFSTRAGLAELQPQHFSALGVSDAADRRKLFLLVQSLQVQMQQKSNRRKRQSPLVKGEAHRDEETPGTPTSPRRDRPQNSPGLQAVKPLHSQSSPPPTLNSVENGGAYSPSPGGGGLSASSGRAGKPVHPPKVRQKGGVVSVFQPSPSSTVQRMVASEDDIELALVDGTPSPPRPTQSMDETYTEQGEAVPSDEENDVSGSEEEEEWHHDLSPRHVNDGDDDDDDTDCDEHQQADEGITTMDHPKETRGVPLRRQSRRLQEKQELRTRNQNSAASTHAASSRLADPPAGGRRGRAAPVARSRSTKNAVSSSSSSFSSSPLRNGIRRVSRLLTPVKRSAATVPKNRNLPTVSIASEPWHAEESQEVSSPEKESVPSTASFGDLALKTSSSTLTAGSAAPKTDTSFLSQILALRREVVEDHKLFAPQAATKSDTTAEMRIRVVVRKRPMSTTESAMAGNVDVLQTLDYASHGKMLVYQPKTRVDLTKEVDTIPFCFDNVFDENTNNAQIYEKAIQPLIPGLFQGKWATLFAYGQSGSGKTYSIMGSVHTTGASACNYGLYFLAAMDIFQSLRKHPGYQVGASLFEIYGGKLFDLFNERQPVKCLEDAAGQIHFPGLSERDLNNPHELMHWIHEGSTLRSTGTTSRNADSSRSHAVLQLHLRRKSDKTEHSRMTLIDLAGSERGADTRTACRTTRMEGAEINTSLLTLKEVIRALAQGDAISHVPFRGSKLTQVLKESFVGSSCRTVMIACVSPNIGNCEHTLNTLRYANRVKERNPETGETSTDSVIASSVQPSNTDSDFLESRVLDELPSDQYNDNCLEPQIAPTVVAEKLGLSAPHFTGHMANPTDLAHSVIQSHKESMKAMLELTSREMELALDRNKSANDYLRDVDRIHEQQLEICFALRKQIGAYRRARSVRTRTYVGIAESDDDSIEDLRD